MISLALAFVWLLILAAIWHLVGAREASLLFSLIAVVTLMWAAHDVGIMKRR